MMDDLMDQDVEPMADGFPRYYMRKPRWGSRQYNRPGTQEEEEATVEQKCTCKKPEEMTWWRWFRTVFLFWALKILDNYLVFKYIWAIPRISRYLTAIVGIIKYKETNKAIMDNGSSGKMFTFPMIRIILKCSFYPLVPVFFVVIFNFFDNILEGPMFRDPWYNQLHMNVKANLATLIEHPEWLRDLYPS